jgi:hypothetical protein
MMRQLPPPMRRAHQPVRRGLSTFSASSDAGGAGSGCGCGGAGFGSLLMFGSLLKNGAGSRTVERRFGSAGSCASIGAVSLGSTGLGAKSSG